MSDTPKSIPLPPGTIDAVAKAIYEVPFESRGKEFVFVWAQADEEIKDDMRNLSRAAITAYERSKSFPLSAELKGEA